MNKELLTEKVFAEIIAANGGRVFRVGGCVRDQLMGTKPKDIDFCIVGMVKKNFKELFPTAKECGKSFPVFRLELDGVKCELAFARTERKVGPGYKGFRVSAKPKVTIQDDLFRRDTTVNSMAMDSLTGEIIDPYNGTSDINAKVLRATSEHFVDDPMRALRLAGQAARLGFDIASETLVLASACNIELADEPKERMLIELTKVFVQAKQPATFFKVLAETNLLQVTFSEIANLDSMDFDRLMTILDGVAELTTCPKLRFAALGVILDLDSITRWNSNMTLPSDWFDSAINVGKIAKLMAKPDAESIVGVINSLRRGALSITEFDIIAKGAKLGILELMALKVAMNNVPDEVPKTLKGKEIGEWLRKKHVEIISKLL